MILVTSLRLSIISSDRFQPFILIHDRVQQCCHLFVPSNKQVG